MYRQFVLILMFLAFFLSTSDLCGVNNAIAANGVVAPTLQSPLNGEEFDSTPEFVWTSPYDDTEANYQMQMSTNSSFTSNILYDKTLYFYGYEDGYAIYTDSSGNELSILNTGPTVRTVYWRMYTKHKTLGNSDYWSETRNFIQYPVVPNAPTLSAPGAGAVLAKSTNVSLVWNGLTSANNYLLQVATDNEFQSTVFSNWVGNVTSYDITSRLSVGTYYWRVRAQNVSGVSDNYSFIRSFSVQCDATIQSFSASATTFDPFKGQNTEFAANLQGVSFTTSTESPSWKINVAGNSFSGQGTPISFLWNGKSSQGKMLQPDTYTAILSVTASDGCSATSSIPITLTMDSTQSSDEIKPTYESNTQDPTTTNYCLTSKESGSSTSIIKGNVTHSQVITALKDVPLPVEFILTYDSLNGEIGPLGLGWDHNYNIRLTTNSTGSVIMHGSDGLQRVYTKTGTTTYQSPQGDISTLTKNAATGTYTITKRGITQNFNANGMLTSIVDRFGNAISLAYDTPTNPSDLKTITDSAGRTIRFEYDTSLSPHRIMRIIDPLAGPTATDEQKYKLCYNVNGQLQRLTNPIPDALNDPERGYWEYLYFEMEYSDDYRNGMLRSRQDPNGNITLYQYYPDGRLSMAIDPEGVTTPTNHTRNFTYNNEVGTIKSTTLTEKDGGVWKYEYDIQKGVLLNEISPQGTSTKYTYYPATNWIKSKTEPFGYSDSLGRQVNLTTFYTYDSYGNLLTRTEPVDLDVYSPVINPDDVLDPATLTSKTPPITPAFSYTYDSNHDKITVVSDLRGATVLTTSYYYSTENGGEVMSVIDPAGKGSITRRNPNGSVKEIVDANNTDVSGTTVTEKSGAKKTVFTYFTDTTENRTAGIVGLLQTVTSPDGTAVTITSYDKNGNPKTIQTKNTDGAVKLTATQQYDALNRLKLLTKIATGLPNIVTAYAYDKIGNMTTLTDAETRNTIYLYNYNGQVKKITQYVTDPATQQLKDLDTIFTYSGSGCSSCSSGVDKLTEVYDAKYTKNSPLESQPHTAYSYDKLGRIDTETDPLGKKLHYKYYDNGLLKEKYDATAATPGTLLVSYLYNNRGQITDKTFTDGAYEHYTYKPNGQLETASNQNISYTYEYYTNGRLQRITDTTNNRVVSYDDYDGLGQKKQVTILKDAGADQRIVNYDYDSANRPWHIYSPAGTFQYDYDNLGRRWKLAYPNQTTATYLYDDLNRLTSLTHSQTGGSTFLTHGYPEHDKVGNRKTRTGASPATYEYDELYRLKKSETAAGAEKFTYDDVGNRQTGPGSKDTNYHYNAANQLTASNILDYGYDNFGNQTSWTLPNSTNKGWILSWDLQNRLTQMVRTNGANTQTIKMKYDPFGQRIEKTYTTYINGSTKNYKWNYVYDGNDVVVEIYTDPTNGATKTYFTHGAGTDEHLALERGGSYYFYHADGLGSITAITDSDRNIVQSYEYEAFGLVKPSTHFVNSYTFAGREWDWQARLYYNHARYFDPVTGRFISKDPLGLQAGINLYSYVQNNPINLVDPDGLEVRFPLIYNFIDPPKEPLPDAEIALQFLPVGSVGKTCSFASGMAKYEQHHIASIASKISGFTEKYSDIFKNAGMSMENAANKIYLEGHSGAHTKIYKQYVLNYLTNATEGLSGSQAYTALEQALNKLKTQLLNNPRMPYKGGM